MAEALESREELLANLTASVVRLVVSARKIGRASGRQDIKEISVYELASAIRKGISVTDEKTYGASRDTTVKGLLTVVMDQITWARFNTKR